MGEELILAICHNFLNVWALSTVAWKQIIDEYFGSVSETWLPSSSFVCFGIDPPNFAINAKPELQPWALAREARHSQPGLSFPRSR